jgi:hypothetical protein
MLMARQIALTNLDKVLYPGSGFTEAHVIDYYIQVANWLLRLLKPSREDASFQSLVQPHLERALSV